MTLTRLHRSRRNAVAIPALAALMTTPLAGAQEAYKRPPDVVVRALEAAPPPVVDLSPDRSIMLLAERRSMPPIADLAQPMLRLAGLRISPNNNAQHNPWMSFTSLRFKPVAGGTEIEIDTPADARITNVEWAPDSSMVAFVVEQADGSSVWVADATTGEARDVTGPRANSILRNAITWMPDSRHLLTRLVPEGRGEAPAEPRVPSGPVVQETSGITAPVRTYQDLLEDTHDEALFDYYLTTQLTFIDATTGDMQAVGEPGVYVENEPSPDGNHILVTKIERPYSYLVTYWSFPETVEIWDPWTGEATTIAEIPLRDQTPIGGVQTGPRSHTWSNVEGSAMLFWAEALDGGDPNVETDERDKVMMLKAPFTGEPVEVARLEDRYSGMQWIQLSSGAFISEYDRDERWARTWLFHPGSGDEPRLVWERNVQDRYNDPGRPITKTNSAGKSVVMLEDGKIFLSGQGSTPEGDRPFFDVMDIRTFETTRLWRNEGESYETASDVIDPAGPVILTSYETVTEPANYFAVNTSTGERTKLTNFVDPAPELAGITKRLVKYEREDGVTLSATLYLPPDYQEGERLPLVVWAYPLEYNDARTGGQISGSPYRFTRISGSSHLFLLTQGYAIMDRATMPVIGDPETVNDTFLEQIVASAKAAIDFAASEGVADPNRVGVGGHSYGAFMTANLLAHCDLFKAGIARSGAYNRTLTPFGFQSERRTLWESPETYFAISPFMHAHKINEPMLMIHGQVDNNSGTFPIQSERMYHAIKGHGGTTRLVMLPHESHGYAAAESVMTVVAEMIEWMDEHVKYAPDVVGSAN